MLPEKELAITDTADHAIATLLESAVRNVVVLGRRGPGQAAFTNPELRELADLEGVDIVVDPLELEHALAIPIHDGSDRDPQRRDPSPLRREGPDRRVSPDRVPLPALARRAARDDRVQAVRIVHNELVAGRTDPARSAHRPRGDHRRRPGRARDRYRGVPLPMSRSTSSEGRSPTSAGA